MNTHSLAAKQEGFGQKWMPKTLLLRGQPMARALQLLEVYCDEHGYCRVALTRCGYEDEGPVLNEWRVQAGQIEQIILHCESDGDWLSLGGYGEVL